MMLVTREFSFEATHFLPDYYGHPEKPHTHQYKLRVTVSGEEQANGIVLDFAVLKLVVQRQVLSLFSGADLNELLPLPSAERIAQFVWEKLSPLPALLHEAVRDPLFQKKIATHWDRPGPFVVQDNPTVRLHEVVVYEDDDTWATYRKDV